MLVLFRIIPPSRPRRYGLLCFALSLAWAQSIWVLDAINLPALAQDGLAAVTRYAPGQKCVLLKNDSVIFGNAYQVGDWVVIQRGDPGQDQQSELRLPRSDVACWADSVGDLYSYRVDHRQSNDFASRLREARWCFINGLLEAAQRECQAAAALRPHDPSLLRLSQQIQHAADKNISGAASSFYASDATTRSDTTTRSDATTRSELGIPDSRQSAALLDVGVDQSQLGQFARSVQVTLINRCGNCHAPNAGRSWVIQSPPGKSRASAALTEKNVIATLPFIDVNQPLDSPLLTRGLAFHADTASLNRQPPLGRRHARAADALARWLVQISNAMQSAKQTQPERDILQTEPVRTASLDLGVEDAGRINTTATNQPRLAAYQDDLQGDGAARRQVSSDQGLAVPLRMPKIGNPFDPELFNRRHHR